MQSYSPSIIKKNDSSDISKNLFNNFLENLEIIDNILIDKPLYGSLYSREIFDNALNNEVFIFLI